MTETGPRAPRQRQVQERRSGGRARGMVADEEPRSWERDSRLGAEVAKGIYAVTAPVVPAPSAARLQHLGRKFRSSPFQHLLALQFPCPPGPPLVVPKGWWWAPPFSLQLLDTLLHPARRFCAVRPQLTQICLMLSTLMLFAEGSVNRLTCPRPPCSCCRPCSFHVLESVENTESAYILLSVREAKEHQ